MFLVEHRVNFPLKIIKSDYAELDVQIDQYDQLVVRHDPDGDGILLDWYLEKSAHKKFFVDIKQNMSTRYYERMVAAFGDRLLGLFDVPYPALHYITKAGLPVYHRLSEAEVANESAYYWLDPLVSQELPTFKSLLKSTPSYAQIILCCPSLHGANWREVENFLSWVKLEMLLGQGQKIQGIVTKEIERARQIIFKEHVETSYD